MTQRLLLARDVAAIDALAVVTARYDLSSVELDLDGRRVRRRARHARRSCELRVVRELRTTSGRPRRPRCKSDGAVTSPMVGTVYLRSGPGAPPFVEVGATVKLGDRPMLIEALGVFTDIVASRAGRVARVLVADGEPVEFGQVLMIIDSSMTDSKVLGGG